MKFRFSTRSLFILVTASAIGLAILLCYWQASRKKALYGNQLRNGAGYENCNTLSKAVAVLRLQLEADDKPEYAALISEKRVRDAIRTAVRSYDAFYSIDEGRKNHSPERVEFWNNEFKPIFLKLADTDEWPAGCAFFASYGLQDRAWITYDGLGLRLEIIAKGNRKFALPIIDLYYGQSGHY